MGTEMRLLTSKKVWLDDKAVVQLRALENLNGICQVVGLPDCHPGRQFPIGCAILSQDWLHPYLIGNDIGCGMRLSVSSVVNRQFKPERAGKKLLSMTSEESCRDDYFDKTDWELSDFHQLGTIGGGNHFAEMQAVHSIKNPELALSLGLTSQSLLLLTHSGSRGQGERILANYLKRYGTTGSYVTSAAATEYLEQHACAVHWGQRNRVIIERRIAHALNCAFTPMLDIVHNAISPVTLDGKDFWLHRKGAAPSDCGPVIIPGSRGTLSYLVLPKQSTPEWLYSLPHGAGRRHPRTKAKERLKNYTKQDLMRNMFGGVIICHNPSLLFEEAPQVYKDISSIIDVLLEHDLIEVIATLEPKLTYKVGGSREYLTAN